MKINPKIIKALKSSQIILLAVMLFALNLVMLFYPSANWLHMGVGSIFIIIILVLVIAAGFDNDSDVLSRKG